jgi:hypothetical protein
VILCGDFLWQYFMAIFYGDFFVAIFNGDIFGDFYGICLLLFYGDILW